MKFDNEKFLKYLFDLSNSRIPWIQRKEISAWSAVLLLYAILWSITSFVNDNNFIFDIKLQPELLLLAIYAICFVFYYFIHAQYASIYYMSAYTNVIRQIIFHLSTYDDNYFDKNNIENFETFNIQINKNTESELKKNIQKFHGKLHPLKILIYFWAYFLIKIFKGNKRKLTSTEKAEASIYSLIILAAFIYTWSIILRLCRIS